MTGPFHPGNKVPNMQLRKFRYKETWLLGILVLDIYP